jgi:hypothetical protein
MRELVCTYMFSAARIHAFTSEGSSAVLCASASYALGSVFRNLSAKSVSQVLTSSIQGCSSGEASSFVLERRPAMVSSKVPLDLLHNPFLSE